MIGILSFSLLDEQTLFNQIKLRDRRAFDTLFRMFYTPLCRFSYALCQSQEDAEECVQDMFVQLWEKAPQINIETSVKAYLYRSVRNHTLNAMEKQQTELRYRNEFAERYEEVEEQKVSDSEIQTLIQQGMAYLPHKCREIFALCKQEGLTYEEISDYLNISEKTVENQMGIALRKLREFIHPKLQKIWVLLIFYLSF